MSTYKFEFSNIIYLFKMVSFLPWFLYDRNTLHNKFRVLVFLRKFHKQHQQQQQLATSEVDNNDSIGRLQVFKRQEFYSIREFFDKPQKMTEKEQGVAEFLGCACLQICNYNDRIKYQQQRHKASWFLLLW